MYKSNREREPDNDVLMRDDEPESGAMARESAFNDTDKLKGDRLGGAEGANRYGRDGAMRQE